MQEINNHIRAIFKCQTKPQVKATNFQYQQALKLSWNGAEKKNHNLVTKSARNFLHLNEQKNEKISIQIRENLN